MKRKNRIPIKTQGMFLSRIGEMLENGFTLAEAIDFLDHLDSTASLHSQKMLKDLQNGIPFYEVLSQRNFDKKACTQLYFADKHGNLSNVLVEAGGYLIKKHQDRLTFLKLLQYPVILIFLLIFVLLLLKNFLLPQFEILYSSMNYRPTKIVSIFIYLMNNAQFFIGCILSLFIIFSLLIYYALNKKTSIQKATLISKIPIVRFYYKLFTCQFLAREWSYLLQGGFSIIEILEMMRSQSFRPLIREIAEKIRIDLTTGLSFSHSLSDMAFLDQQFITVTIHGEKNGRLDHELLFYSKYCLLRMEENIQKIFRILQPIMFIFIGCMIIAVYLSILLPMFEMIDSI
ncbi:competence type IV pilus assembly protein ComGB [Heyndrickxia sporothermodurans]|uniref:competence type IV pilus assembly protein ComGB n=1 Tax=Heyndrickxia sporothermodurans TaxID=46224 RepID=UPI0015E7488C|nr:competence type IV pilus assembly protein ComGB [Heyndrickxia sporothermodurans]